MSIIGYAYTSLYVLCTYKCIGENICLRFNESIIDFHVVVDCKKNVIIILK